jgi:hypothetical protein
MEKKFDQFKADLKVLTDNGIYLWNAIRNEQIPEVIEDHFKNVLKIDYEKFAKSLPVFKTAYQPWYSQALAMIKLLMPERLTDFSRLYEVPKGRKSITKENYVIEDYLNNVEVTGGFENKIIAGPIDALPQFELQLNILKSVSARFETTLFDIRQHIQAELLDAELDAAELLLKNKHFRSAGIICGVVLQTHLSQVLANQGLKPLKKTAKIADYNEALKKAAVYDFPTYRLIVTLADLHQLCLKEKKREPSQDEIEDLIAGTDKVIKTIF